MSETDKMWKWTLRKCFVMWLILGWMRAHASGAAIAPSPRDSPIREESPTRLAQAQERPRVTKRGTVKLAVIAPADPNHELSLPRILPAITLAVRSVRSAKGPLPGWTIIVNHRDSKCSSTHGSLAAFDFYINRTAGQSMHLSVS